MDLVVEYLIRRGGEFRPFHKDAYADRWQMWAYFILAHRKELRELSPALESVCDSWLTQDETDWDLPGYFEQQDMLFAAIPYLRPVWESWKNSCDSNSSRDPITT